ncbi:hypothetical protein [uncultured Aquimarina sp.]|uniref:hypothetical protein n=1 Tax=uncultured Aquimarina sp. TaxID=575652 RepID=UPI00260BCC25|nr:hypothetical protein [uncultured Aquimarina sp.]
MGRATFDNFQDKFLSIEFPSVVEPFPWEVTREGEDITFTLGSGEDEKSEIHKTTDVRKFLLKNFNWNGIVHFMHLLSDKNDSFTYTRPTDLKGIPDDDDILIIPDEATEAIVYEQAKYAIETKYADAPEDNIDKILKYVDGKAKTGFSTDTLETTYEDLIKESDNSEMSYNGTSFAMPDLDTVSEADLYDFLKNLSLSRNSLWIDEDKTTNFISIRRVLETSSTKYNDTLFLAWKEGETKKALQYIGSTEPGNLSDGQLLPQTTNMILGLHITSKATPAGRTQNAYRKGDGNTNHYFQSGDTTMNIHYGSHGIEGLPTAGYGTLKNNKYNPGYNQTELEAYLIIVKFYRILTQWGAGRYSEISSYQNLENHTRTLSVSNVIGNSQTDKKVNILRDTDDVVKTIMYSTYVSYITNNYKTTGKKTIDTVRKNNANRLLMNYHKRQNDGVPDDCYSGYELKDLLEELKQDKVFKSIILTQLEYELNLKKVDAQPGGGTIKKIEWSESQKNQANKKFNDQKNKAKADWDLISKVIQDWENNQILKDAKQKVGDIEFNLIEYLKDNFKLNSKDYDENSTNEVDNKGGDEISINVDGWSEGCQIIYGGQHFYEFLYKLTQFVKDSNQERWYYTLVDIDTIDGVTIDD